VLTVAAEAWLNNLDKFGVFIKIVQQRYDKICLLFKNKKIRKPMLNKIIKQNAFFDDIFLQQG
jgi:hypothetical protein